MDIYADGSYLENNPTWHEEDSAWKAQHIRRLLTRNQLTPRSICEIGCGAGGILQALAADADEGTRFHGYEISPQAYELCLPKANANLSFQLGDLLAPDNTDHFDLVMAIDVFEHVEDCFGFLRALRDKAEHKLYHIPLDLSVQTVLRASPIMHARTAVGHLHYFTKETALATLRDTGHEIVDHAYTGGSLELPGRGWKANLAKLPRRLAFALSPDLAVRVLGGCSLMVLAR